MWVYQPKSLCYLSFFCFPTRELCDRNDLEVKTRDELLSSLFSLPFFLSPFSTKILPCINLFFSFILSSHYLYQFPFSSMKQKLTKNRIPFSDPTTTMLRYYFATFLCLYVFVWSYYDNIEWTSKSWYRFDFCTNPYPSF